jgi:hypothetical protein
MSYIMAASRPPWRTFRRHHLRKRSEMRPHNRPRRPFEREQDPCSSGPLAVADWGGTPCWRSWNGPITRGIVFVAGMRPVSLALAPSHQTRVNDVESKTIEDGL